MISLLKKPSAWVPIAIPLIFFGYIVFILFTSPAIVREEDEGTAAHLFQLWLVLEPLILGYFLFRGYLTAPRETLFILALQIAAALLPISLVFSLGL